MERLKNWFADQGLGPQDIPKAVIIHEVLGAGMALAAWSACYAIEPSSQFFKPVNEAANKNKFLQRTYSRALVQSQNTIAAMSQHIPGTKRLNTGRLTVSLAESICFRAAIKPITFPFKLWASYKMVMLTKPRMRNSFASLALDAALLEAKSSRLSLKRQKTAARAIFSTQTAVEQTL